MTFKTIRFEEGRSNMKIKTIVLAAVMAVGVTSGASAGCKAPFGTIANNDLLSFHGTVGLNNTSGFKRIFKQGPRKSGGTVTPSAECKAIIFPASGGHQGAQKGQKKSYSANVRGIGCAC